jgi:hypothetical protein
VVGRIVGIETRPVDQVSSGAEIVPAVLLVAVVGMTTAAITFPVRKVAAARAAPRGGRVFMLF